MATRVESWDAARITGARNWEAVRADFPEQVDAMGRGLRVGDPPADAVVTELMSIPGASWGALMAALDRPEDLDDAFPEAAHLVRAAATPPPWFEPDLARAGAEAWWRFGSLQSSTLYQSLIYGYQAPGFVRPLVATGRLTDRTWDRVQSTARWVTLATAPGLMEPGGQGWLETLRIRLVHAMVRHHLHAECDWDDDAWGVPINQTYAQLTITAGFLVLPIEIAEDLGIRYSRADLEAITHLWRWIGWVMGVDEDLLPHGFADAQRIHRISQRFRLRPESESKVLVRALLDDGYRTDLGLPGPLNDAVHVLARPFLRPLLAAVSTRWVDREIAREMGLRSTPLHHVVDLARPVIRSRELIRAIGLLGSERTVAQRELRLVAHRLGIDLDARPGTPTDTDAEDLDAVS
ncbi:oxygenase MpaB family protein [Gordonia sp. NPDC003376]